MYDGADMDSVVLQGERGQDLVGHPRGPASYPPRDLPIWEIVLLSARRTRLNSSWLIGWLQAHEGAPVARVSNVSTDLTSCSRAIFGSGLEL